MAAIINTNLASLNAQRNLSTSQSQLSQALTRLSSGLRINSAKDDAAGMAIASRMSATIRGSVVAIRNANDGISLVQTAEGALNQVGDNLQRMRELAVQARNVTNGTSEKTALNDEFGKLASEVTRIIGGTTFNGQNILAANAGTLSFQVGSGTASQDQISVTTTRLDNHADITTVTAAAITGDATAVGTVITNLDTALNRVRSELSAYGATQSRFESVIANLQTTVEAQTAARSRIMDADFAAETAALTRGQILQQAGTAMLAQANQMPNTVLSLLRG